MQTELIALLQAYQPQDQAEQEFRRLSLEFASTHSDCCRRSCAPGHFTASAWILSPDADAVLLTHHKKLQRWLQLGGHIEADQSLTQAALREAYEESGLAQLDLLDSALFDLDVHAIPARADEPQHWHYDLRFLLRATDLHYTVSAESHQLAWLSLQELQHQARHQQLDASMQRMLLKTLALKKLWRFD